MVNDVFLGLGSNIGDRETYLSQAIDEIRKSSGEVISYSAIYETAPWGFSAEGKFLNMVIGIRTVLKPEKLLKNLLKIENGLGRLRIGKGYSSRTIDIDILLYDDLVIDKPELKIPHPLIQERRFVLVPLCDIAAERIHPLLAKSFETLLQECRDENVVIRYQ